MPSLHNRSTVADAVVANAVLAASCLAAAAALLAAPSAARATEGVIPLPAGDSVRGTLRRCWDREVAEVELLRGEVFTFKVRSARLDNETILVHVTDPQGLPSNVEADVRIRGGAIQAGPFRVPSSGTWRFGVSTLVAHGATYEATTKIRRTRGARASLGGRRRGAVLPVAAGSAIRVSARRDVPALALRLPGDATARVIAPGSPEMDALTGPGLAAPRSGNYEVSLASATGRARVRVTPPRRTTPEVIDFPALPDDQTAVASWQATAGWVVDPTQTAPDEHGETPPPGAPTPTTSPFSGSLTEDCPAPGESLDATALDDASAFPGPASGVGLPAAGIPRLDDVLRYADVETGGGGPSYVMTRRSDALGDVTTRVWFLVEGRATQAPLALDGRVTVRWTDDGGSQQLHGSWFLSTDPVRGVQVLDGSEHRSLEARTVTSSAVGFAVAVVPGSWPQGRLAFGFSDPRIGRDFTRVETYGGGTAVRVAIVRGDGTSDSAVFGY